MIIPIVLLAWQERPAFQHEDALAAGGEPMEQRPPARARADDDDVEMIVHDGNWSGCGGKPYEIKPLLGLRKGLGNLARNVFAN